MNINKIIKIEWYVNTIIGSLIIGLSIYNLSILFGW